MGAWLAALGLWAGLVAAADLRHRRIPNALLLPGLALVLWAGLLPGGASALAMAGGGLVGLAALLPAWRWGLLGGGDVKLAVLLGAMDLAALGWALAIAFGLDLLFARARLRLLPARPAGGGRAFAPALLGAFILVLLLRQLG